MSEPRYLSKAYSGHIDVSDLNSSWTKIIRFVGYSKRVLEVGCAAGYMSAFLTTNRGCQVTAIEINPDSARQAAGHCEHVIVADVEAGAYDQVSGIFDVIVFADVLEHLRDPWSTLRECHRLLTPDGYVVISLPNVVHWDTRRAFLAGRFEYTEHGTLDSTHLRFFTHRTALNLIKSAGFEVQEFDVVIRGPRYWKYDFYRRWERPLNRLVRRFFRGLFAFQFVFKIRLAEPHEDAGMKTGGQRVR